MTIEPTAVTRCSGTNHITVTLSINGGAARGYPVNGSDLTFEGAELEDRILGRLVSACKEANANTWAKVQNALVGKTFKV